MVFISQTLPYAHARARRYAADARLLQRLRCVQDAEQLQALLRQLRDEGYLEQTAALLQPMALSQPDNGGSGSGAGSDAGSDEPPSPAASRGAAGAAAVRPAAATAVAGAAAPGAPASATVFVPGAGGAPVPMAVPPPPPDVAAAVVQQQTPLL